MSANHRHRNNCKDCKRLLIQVLQVIDSGVVDQAPNLYRSDPTFYPSWMSQIHEQLIERSRLAGRGPQKNSLSVRSRPFDYFLPAFNCYLEFDEDQHFTEARALSLSLYPQELALGFDREEWMNRCLELRRVDLDPPHRDEQRAWLDTLRDLAPVIVGRQDGVKFAPTIRLCESTERLCERELVDVVESFRVRLKRSIH